MAANSGRRPEKYRYVVANRAGSLWTVVAVGLFGTVPFYPKSGTTTEHVIWVLYLLFLVVLVIRSLRIDLIIGPDRVVARNLLTTRVIRFEEIQDVAWTPRSPGIQIPGEPWWRLRIRYRDGKWTRPRAVWAPANWSVWRGDAGLDAARDLRYFLAGTEAVRNLVLPGDLLPLLPPPPDPPKWIR